MAEKRAERRLSTCELFYRVRAVFCTGERQWLAWRNDEAPDFHLKRRVTTASSGGDLAAATPKHLRVLKAHKCFSL